MKYTRVQLKEGLKANLKNKEASTHPALLSNTEYLNAACLLSIMEFQDNIPNTVGKK